MAPARKRQLARFPTAIRLAVWLLMCALPLPASLQAATPSLAFVQAPGSPIQVPELGGSIAIGDFNHDGKLDFVLTGATLRVYLGNGDGTFRATTVAGVDGRGYPVVADFNGDGVLDVAVNKDTTLTVLLGNGDGTFRPAPGLPLTFPNGIGPLFVTDLNSDGALDIVGAGTAPQNGVPVLLGNGDGTFRPAPALPIVDVYDGYPVAVHDYNNDGVPDVVYAGFPADTSPRVYGIRVLLGNGDGTFRVGPFTTPLLYPEHVVGQGMFRRGDALDVVLAGGTVMRSNGDGTFTQIVATNTTSVGGAAADYNSDGLTDFAFTANSSNNHVYVVTSNGDGTFTVAYEFPSSGEGQVVAGDVNGDGRPDLLTNDGGITVGTGVVHVYLNTSPNLASQVASQPAPHAAASVAVSTPAAAPPSHLPTPTPTPLPQPPPRTTTGSAKGTDTTTAATPLPTPPPTVAAATSTPLPAPLRH